MKTHPRYYELLEKMKDIAEKKGSDYSGQKDVYENFKVCEEFGVPSFMGVLIRITDKHSRLKQLTRKMMKDEAPAVADESFKDTLIDMANYCLICTVLFEEYEKDKIINSKTSMV
jgi:hypothetical protein